MLRRFLMGFRPSTPERINDKLPIHGFHMKKKTFDMRTRFHNNPIQTKETRCGKKRIECHVYINVYKQS